MTGQLLDVIMACIAQTVTLDEAIDPDTSLFDMPSFDSLAIHELLEASEAALGVELAPELVVPASFANARALARAFQASRARIPAVSAALASAEVR